MSESYTYTTSCEAISEQLGKCSQCSARVDDAFGVGGVGMADTWISPQAESDATSPNEGVHGVNDNDHSKRNSDGQMG